MKLYGDLQTRRGVILSSQQLEESIARSQPFADLLDKLYLSRTMLFVGASIEGIETFLRGTRVRPSPSQRHYALVAVSDESWRVKAEALQRRFGIQFIPYRYEPDSSAIADFLERIRAELVAAQRDGVISRQGVTAQTRLARVELTNIGPYEGLELDLDEKWNLILGDNGVGKSSVIQAIGLALCGADAAPYAERLLKAGSPSGEIVLRSTSGRSYSTILSRRTGGGVDVSCPERALDVEGWLAVGFPALRTVTWTRDAKPNLSLGSQRPTTADVLPLLSDSADPRLDDLKQQIVTLHHLSLNEIITSNAERRSQDLIKKFFDLFDELAGGMKVRLKTVNPQTREIIVTTDDGDVPIEALSQGTISLISWVGVLVQRLYEVARLDEDPSQKYALVLVDELDAHMHPAWQASIVSQLDRAFPHLQFVVTTHSPLVVRGKAASQIVRFKRNEDGSVGRMDIDDDVAMGRQDQLLASPLFDVDPAFDELTEKAIEDYQKLLGKESRDEAEEADFVRLTKLLEFRIPVPATTLADRRAQELVAALLREQAGQHPEVTREVLSRAKQLFSELQRKEVTHGSNPL